MEIYLGNENQKWFKPLIIAILLLPAMVANGQSVSVKSDRPGQALNPNLIETGFIQIQSGYQRFFNSSSSASFQGHTHDFRFGLNDNWETGASIYTSVIPNQTNVTTLVGQVRRSLAANDAFEALAIQVALPLQINPRDVNNTFNPMLKLSGSRAFNDKIGFTGNIALQGVDVTNNFSLTLPYVANLGWSFNSKLAVFIEHFGSLNNTGWQANADCGVSYLAHAKLQLDFTFGFTGINQTHTQSFMDTGITFKI
ncbi:hypothetical protein [Luteibaculum oceani]|uniref:Transporter n=1 Tax=Luteibaculum oceani TaxID=1294296 RepID=A0A5C6USF3_9FLAO|nr:hypothetical protein [Luteibaculum oceani]TXC76262.1 hypothetical protein FRX97_10980 [Luteibaculum oceani]